MDRATEQYLHLRHRVDQRSAELVQAHHEHLACKAGCFDCCTNISMFPVEYHAILDELRRAGRTDIPFDPAASCVFLTNGLCGIYEFRPLICRTHGLPIAFFEDEDAAQPSVSFCPKNFKDIPPEHLDFGPDNTLDLARLNDELFEIHLQYLDDNRSLNLRPNQRIPLRQLRKDLTNQDEPPAAPQRAQPISLPVLRDTLPRSSCHHGAR